MVLEMESTGEVRSTAGNGGGITVVGSDAPSDFHIAARSESSNPSPNSVAPPLPQSHHTNQLAIVAPTPQISMAATTMMEGISGVPMKKKRGRPRKYGPDGAVVALSPKPISSAPAPSHPIPASSHVIDFSASEKRSKMKPTNSFNRTKFHHQVENLENVCKNGEADEQDFRTEKTMSRKRRASKGEAKEMAQTEEGAVNGGKVRSLLLVLVF